MELVKDQNVEQQLNNQSEKAQKMQSLIDMRMRLIQQCYTGTMTREGMMPALKILAEDPYFGDVKFMGKPSGIADASGQAAMVAVSPKDALVDMMKALDENMKELRAMDSGIILP